MRNSDRDRRGRSPDRACLRLAGLLCCLLLCGIAAAQEGGGSGDDPSLTWQSTRSDHFVVHFPANQRDPDDPHAFNGARLAQRTTEIAEDLYQKLSQLVSQPLPGPIHIVLEAQRDEPAGLAEPEWRRIKIGAHPGPAFPLRGEGDWLKESIAHELSHLAMAYAGSPVPPGRAALLEAHLSDRDWLGRLRGAPLPADPELELGARVPVADAAPFFWTEGGAEYLAELSGANRWSSGRDMLLRTSTLENLILSPDALQSSLGKTGFEGERGYNQGYAFMLFLRERYGEQSFFRILGAAGRKLRFDWTGAVEEGQGLSYPILYARWKEWLNERYQPLADLRTREVVGEELTLSIPPWRSPDLEVRRRWLAMPAEKRQADREGDVLLAAYPSWSPDGRYLASWENGLKIRALAEEQWPVYGARPLEAYRDRLELARRTRRQGFVAQVRQYPMSWSPDGKRLVVVADEGWHGGSGQGEGGFRWNALYLVDVTDPGHEGLTLSVAAPGTPIPNTLRGQDPAWSPDGEWIAFVKVTDGTGNLWIIHPDGTGARALTQFADGTTIGHPSWSPDSRQLVFHLFRRGQRDLWTIDPKRQLLQPVMMDSADDQDPCWASDGKIYYSSDGNGIFNLYSYDPSTSEVRRLSDVLGGAFSPALTASGNLTFVYFDGYAFKLYGLPAQKLLAIPVDNAAFFVDPTLARANLQGAQEATAVVGHAYRVLEGGLHVAVTPVLRLTERDVMGGAELRWEDALERHALRLDALAGMGTVLSGAYTYSRLFPALSVGAWRRSSRESVVLEPEDTEGQRIEKKREQVWRSAFGTAVLPLSRSLRVSLAADGRRTELREREDGAAATPVYDSVGGGAALTVSTFRGDPDHGARGIDPRGGLRFELRYSVRESRVWDPLTGDLLVDEGQALGTYLFHRVDLGLQQALALPWRAHSLEWRLDVAAINRNVAWWDELKAGTRLGLLEPQLEPLVPFPGYREGSLSGETLGVLSFAYRLPVRVRLAKSRGPLYVDSVYAQAGGTVGNVWGFRSDGNDGVIRERPLQDVPVRSAASADAPGLLAELGLELRVQSSIFNRYRWGSFLHVGYALSAAGGLGDVNQDGVYPGRYGDVVPTAGGEINPAGLRVSLGLGTGF